MKKLEALDIKTIEHLCCQLGTSASELAHIQRDPSIYYSTGERIIKEKPRSIATPHGELRRILDTLQPLLQRVHMNENTHGGIKGRSAKSNAIPHSRKPVVIKLDLKDFFPGVTNRMVYAAFVDELGCSPEVARCLTRLTTLDGCLPQGSPTSTIISCIVIQPLVRRISRLALTHGASYTQYIDDITISGPAHVSRLIPTIERIINQRGFRVNPLKTRVLEANDEQVVTGIRVNGGIDAPSEHINAIKKVLRQISAGEVRASSATIASIKGKIHHIGQLNPGAGRYYSKKFNKILRESCQGPAEPRD